MIRIISTILYGFVGCALICFCDRNLKYHSKDINVTVILLFLFEIILFFGMIV